MFIWAAGTNPQRWPDIDGNNPFIGFNNIVSTSDIVASQADASFPATNLANPSTFLNWKGTAAVETVINVTLDGHTTVDYIALAGHNFGSGGIDVALEYATASTPVDILTEASVKIATEAGTDDLLTEGYVTYASRTVVDDDLPLIIRFTPRSDLVGLQVRLYAGTAIPQAAVCYVGQSLISQRRIYVGHTPIQYGRVTNVVNGMSESGNFLGRIVTGEYRQNQVVLANLSPDWYRSYFEPFMASAVEDPFFFAWRPTAYPDETGFCWLNADAQPVNQLPNGMMSVTLNLTGIAS